MTGSCPSASPSHELPNVTPPQSTVTPSNTAPVLHAVDVEEALELDWLDEALLATELLALDLLDAALLAAELLALDLLEAALLLALLEEAELLALELLLEEEAPLLGTEHSLTPPATRVPVPKVASLHTKLPLTVL